MSRFLGRLQFRIFLRNVSCLLTTNLSRRNKESRASPLNFLTFEGTATDSESPLQSTNISRYLAATEEVHSNASRCKWLNFCFTTMMQRNQRAHTAWPGIYQMQSLLRDSRSTDRIFCHFSPNSFQAGRAAYRGPRKNFEELDCKYKVFRWCIFWFINISLTTVLKAFVWVVTAIQRFALHFWQSSPNSETWMRRLWRAKIKNWRN